MQAVVLASGLAAGLCCLAMCTYFPSFEIFPDAGSTIMQAVDMVLAGGQAAGQVRERTPEGDILSYTQVRNGAPLTRKIIRLGYGEHLVKLFMPGQGPFGQEHGVVQHTAW